MRLKSKIAAITGAGDGIGRAAAELFAKEGAKVIVLEVNPETGRKIEEKINKEGGEAKFIQTDVSDEKSVRKAFDEITDAYGKLHILYNNASVYLGKHDNTVSEIPLEIWKKVLDINLNGLFYCSRYALPLMIKSGGGSIINTSSSAGLIGIPKCDAYTASKGATITLTRSMAVEYGPQKVRVNCIAPAAIYTDMVRESNLDQPDFDEELFYAKVPLRRWGQPEEVAQVALFLASEESSYVTGAVIVADGAITLTNVY